MEMSEDTLRKEIVELTNSLFETAYLNTNTLKRFFSNLIVLDEICDSLAEIRQTHALKTGINLEDVEVFQESGIFEKIYNEFAAYLQSKGIELIDRVGGDVFALTYKRNPRGIESRYERIKKVTTHLINTPTTTIALVLNIDKARLFEKLGGDADRISDSLIEKHSWRDKLLKGINYYKYSYVVNEKEFHLLSFLEGYLKLSNIIEILGKDRISSEVRNQIVERIGDPMIKISGGIIQYKDVSKGKTPDLSNMLNELNEILSKIMATFGKVLTRNSERALKYGIIESIAPIYVLGTNPLGDKMLDAYESRKIETLRSKLAKLIIERHKLDESEEPSGNLDSYEGENIWRNLLLDRVLCRNTNELFLILGLPVARPDEELNYNLLHRGLTF